MLNFDRVEFHKGISLNPQKNKEIKTKWQQVRLREIAEITKWIMGRGKGRIIKNSSYS